MMREIKETLEKITAMANGWATSGGPDQLERDLALDMLREVYAALKFGGSAGVTANATAVVESAAIEIEDDAAADEPEVWEEQDTDVKPEAGHEYEPQIVPRRVAPDVIRSLYGLDAEQAAVLPPMQAPETKAVEEAALEPETRPRHQPEPETQPKPEPEPRPEPEPQHHPEPETKPRPTLGDAISAGRKTLGETLRSGSGERDMASHIASAQAQSSHQQGLKRSIGLNDRFLMIRDMFSGDPDAFDRAIARLDTFTSLDEAAIWIHDNFDWSADSKGVALLMSLLERKLGR